MTTTYDTKRQSDRKVDVTHTEECNGAHWEYRSNGDIAMYLPMLTCTRSLTASYGGQSVTLTAGVSRVCRDHDLARAYPHHFTGAAAAPVRDRSTGRSAAVEAELRMRSELLSQLRAQTTADQTPRTAPSQGFLRDAEPTDGWTYENCGVELRSNVGRGGSPLSVRIGRDAWDEILGNAEHYQGDLGVECFGALYAPGTRPTSRSLFVSEATEIGLKRSYGSVHADLDDLHANERRRLDGDIRSGGSWHTQPTTIKPSPADLATWRHAHMHAHSRHRAWRQVHLILAPGKARPERRWRRPQIGAYTLRREDDSLGYRYLCEPATIILP
ncbi:MAG: hypothetical protein ACJ738_02115 [Gaiellales bacterium]